DGGMTWAQVDLPKESEDLGCEMAVGDDGTLHVVWDSLTCGFTNCTAEKTFYTRSTDGGLTFSTPVQVASHKIVSFSGKQRIPAENERGINPFGTIDVDNNSASAFHGRLYYTYSDKSRKKKSYSTANIFVRRSLDNGATWSSAIKVNDDGKSPT